MFILTYDENDGLFDHVAPPTAASDTPDELVDRLPIGPGFRVPTIIVSPYTRGGWVCSDPFDHTSVIRFLVGQFGVPEPNISAYRAGTLGDLTSAFRQVEAAPRDYPSLPDTGAALDLARSQIQSLPTPTPGRSPQVMPQQEPTRQSS